MSKLSPEERARCDSALAEARVILEKVFDSFVISARFEDMDVRSAIITEWHGNFTDAIGLAQVAVWRFQERERTNQDSTDAPKV